MNKQFGHKENEWFVIKVQANNYNAVALVNNEELTVPNYVTVGKYETVDGKLEELFEPQLEADWLPATISFCYEVKDIDDLRFLLELKTINYNMEIKGVIDEIVEIPEGLDRGVVSFIDGKEHEKVFWQAAAKEMSKWK